MIDDESDIMSVENKKECVLNNFKLINLEEIIDFIHSNSGLLELIETVYPLLKSYFPDCSFSLLYAPDPEIKDFEDLMLFIKTDEKEYKNSRKKLYDLEREIDNLKVSNCNIKRLLLLDVIL